LLPQNFTLGRARKRTETSPYCTIFHRMIAEWRQPAGTTAGKRPHLKPREIHHVDVLAWLRRLRAAPSRTSPISTMRSRDRAFAQFAAHNHPTRRDFISAEQAGTSCQRIYPAVTDPGIKPISSVGHGWRPDPPCLRQVFCGMAIFACWITCRQSCTPSRRRLWSRGRTWSTFWPQYLGRCAGSWLSSSSSCRRCALCRGGHAPAC